MIRFSEFRPLSFDPSFAARIQLYSWIIGVPVAFLIIWPILAIQKDLSDADFVAINASGCIFVAFLILGLSKLRKHDWFRLRYRIDEKGIVQENSKGRTVEAQWGEIELVDLRDSYIIIKIADGKEMHICSIYDVYRPVIASVAELCLNSPNIEVRDLRRRSPFYTSTDIPLWRLIMYALFFLLCTTAIGVWYIVSLDDRRTGISAITIGAICALAIVLIPYVWMRIFRWYRERAPAPESQHSKSSNTR